MELVFNLMRFWRGDAALILSVPLDELPIWLEQSERLGKLERPDG